MFCGIVETIGKIIGLNERNGCKDLVIAPHLPFDDLTIGDSIAVNGTCLTVTKFTPTSFQVTVVPETLRLTNLQQLVLGQSVNLERAVTLATRIGGHYVQGHVDGMGEIMEINQEGGEALLIKIKLPHHLSKYTIDKGYIAIDGMSITLIQATADWISVTLIPHTQAVTIAKNYRIGTKVNLEVDMISKYIEKLLEARNYANTN